MDTEEIYKNVIKHNTSYEKKLENFFIGVTAFDNT